MRQFKIPLTIEIIQHLLNDGAYNIEINKSIDFYFYMEEPKGYIMDVNSSGQVKVLISKGREI